MISLLNKIEGLSYDSIVQGKLVDAEKNMTAKSFKVYIPKYMPLIPFGDTKITQVNINSRVLNKKKITAKTIATKNYLDARSMTDYRIRYDKANVWEMDSSLTTTEIAQAKGEWKCPKTDAPHTPNHVHQIIQPIELYDFKIETLNIHKISRGETLTLKIFEMGDIRVDHLDNKVPQDGD